MDREYAERIATIFVGIAVAGSAISFGLPVPVGVGEALVGGTGLLTLIRNRRRRRQTKESIDTICDSIMQNWRHWVDARDPGALESAYVSFKETAVHCAPDPKTLVDLGLDPDNVAGLMLVRAEGRHPDAYAERPSNEFNRQFFLAVIRGGYAALLAQPAMMQNLLLPLAREIVGQLDRIQFAQERQEGKSDAQMAMLLEIRDLVERSRDAPRPREEMDDLPAHSNTAADADSARHAAKAAMQQNDIAAALRHMQEAEEIEAAAEAERLRRADDLEARARDARDEAETQSISRARTQAAYASLRYATGDFQGATDLYESAIRRLPLLEDERRNRFALRLRVVLNVWAAATDSFPSTREILTRSGPAAAQNVFSYSILLNAAPDYPTARGVLDEMVEAEVPPNVVTFNSLLNAAPDYPTAREVLDEMFEAGVPPNVVTFSSLLNAAPDYPTAREVLDEMVEAGVPPNVVTFSSLLKAAPDYATAREVFDEMVDAKVPPDAFTFNNLLNAAPDYATAREVLDEMVEAGVPPDAFTFNSLLHAAPDYTTAREVFDGMVKAKVPPDAVTVTSLASTVRTTEQASELRGLFRSLELAGTAFHQAVFAQFCKILDATELLEWAFAAGGFPFNSLDAAIAGYRRQGKNEDALRIASAFAYLEPCRKLFRDRPGESRAYLQRRYEGGEEPHLAAGALGIWHEEHEDIASALHWLQIAHDHPKTTAGKKRVLAGDIGRLRAAS